MPTIKRLCPGCKRVLVQPPTVRCPPCESAFQRRRDARRGTARERGYGSAHEAWARAVLATCPLCAVCEAPAVVADHIVPFRSGGAKYDVRNGQGLCLACSGRKDGGIRR